MSVGNRNKPDAPETFVENRCRGEKPKGPAAGLQGREPRLGFTLQVLEQQWCVGERPQIMIGGQLPGRQPVSADQQIPASQPNGYCADGCTESGGGNPGNIVEYLFLLRRIAQLIGNRYISPHSENIN